MAGGARLGRSARHLHPGRARGARTTGLTIRSAAAGDLDAIVAINRAAATTAYRPIYRDAPYPEPGVRRRYERLLADSAATVLVAEHESAAVGYAAARPGRLEALYVVPEAWGSGVAQALYEDAVAVAGPVATLWVLRDNARGRRFWERRGWEPTGEEDATGAVELLYRLGVTPEPGSRSEPGS